MQRRLIWLPRKGETQSREAIQIFYACGRSVVIHHDQWIGFMLFRFRGTLEYKIQESIPLPQFNLTNISMVILVSQLEL